VFTRLAEVEEEARRAHEARIQAQRFVQILEEKVKLAEEEAQVYSRPHNHNPHTLKSPIPPQTHARKKLEAEEEIRRVRASAVKVYTLYIVY